MIRFYGLRLNYKAIKTCQVITNGKMKGIYEKIKSYEVINTYEVITNFKVIKKYEVIKIY